MKLCMFHILIYICSIYWLYVWTYMFVISWGGNWTEDALIKKMRATISTIYTTGMTHFLVVAERENGVHWQARISMRYVEIIMFSVLRTHNVDIRTPLTFWWPLWCSFGCCVGPSPDWVVGVSGMDLCKKDCTWIDHAEVDLFPYDAGTDGGISYMVCDELPRFYGTPLLRSALRLARVVQAAKTASPRKCHH